MIQRKPKGKATSLKTKLWADILLTFSMGATGIVMGLPLNDNTKLWIVAAINFVGMGGKLLTNVFEFKEKEEQLNVPEQPAENASE